MVELATHADRIVGHYAVLPRWLQIGGKKLKAGLAVHAAVHPQFRGLVLLQGLMRRIGERCREASIPFLYAFPKERVWRMYQRVFQWESLGEIVALELPVERLQILDEDIPGIAYRGRALFGERYERLHYAQGFQGLNFCLKSREDLHWRYGRHPRVEYQLIEADSPQGGLAGYLVLKLYEKQGIRYGHFVDLDLKPEFHALWPPMATRALLEFRKQGVEVASCWMLQASPFWRALRQLGFEATGFSTTVGCQQIDPAFPVHALRLGNWHLVMGDSDAF